MNKIEFSHVYQKMPFDDWDPNHKLDALLLEVFLSEKNKLFRKSVRKHNQIVNFGIDPEL